MKNVLVIADIAGEMDALLRLVDLVPKDTVKISVGDMGDRGPRSREVYEYFMKGYGEDRYALLGNHEHMLLHAYGKVSRRMYEPGCWNWNGAYETLQSFPEQKVFPEIVEWIDSLPLSMEVDVGAAQRLHVSHAPWHDEYPLFPEDLTANDIFKLTWNREEPIYHASYMQIFGHNSHWGLREFRHNSPEQNCDIPYALCIDQCRQKILTGYLFPECKIISVPYSTEPKEPAFEENSES